MFLILVKPKFLSFKNRIFRGGQIKNYLVRDILVLLFSFMVMSGLYNATYTLLERLHLGSKFAYLPPSLPLSLLLLFLTVLLLFSNAVAALGAFFLSKELDLVLTSPIGRTRFFFGKFAEIYATSSWMALLFGAPSFIALGNYYQATPLFYVGLVCALIPLFVIPSALSITITTLFASIISANRTREVFFFGFSIVFITLYIFFGDLYTSESLQQDFSGIGTQLTGAFRIPSSAWLPSYWASQCLGGLLTPGITFPIHHFIALSSVAIASVCLAYILVYLLHDRAYSMAKSSKSGISLRGSQTHRKIRTITAFVPGLFRAISSKEYRIFARDMTQALQLLMLLGICILYLYNFQALHEIQNLKAETRIWWQAFLVISNLLMGSFVLTAVCARFVFPSLSLEGNAFWILQSAPCGDRRLMTAKFAFWYTPVSIIAITIFTSGALAIQSSHVFIILSIISGIVMCYGIVGLATGLGAYFINLAWEHPSQLTTGFGSLVFMLSSTLLILFNLAPLALVVFLYTLEEFGYHLSPTAWRLMLASATSVLLYGNYAVKRWSFDLGERRLSQLRG